MVACFTYIILIISDDDDDDDDIGFAAQYNDDVMPHMASLASLKVSNTESLNEDDAEQQKVLSSDGDPTGEAAAEMTEEEMDWQKQLQLMSAAYKPKVVEHAKVCSELSIILLVVIS